MSIATRAEGLLSRAVHNETPVEEARTAAFLLAKLIATHGLIILAPEDYPEPAVTPSPPLAPEGKWVSARWAGRCPCCGKSVKVGDQVWWTKDRGIVCRPCHEAGAV